MKKIYGIILMAVMLCCGTTVWGATTVLSEGFESNNLATNGWTRQSCHSKSLIGTEAKHEGSYGFLFYYNTNPPQYLISKALAIPSSASEVNVSLFYKAYSSYGTEKFQVGYSTTDNDVDSFTWDTEVSTNSTSWAQYTNSSAFPKETKYIAIRYNANDQYRLYIDDIEVTCNLSGPALTVFDGDNALSSGDNYNFGLATAGTTKTFTLSNPGTEATPVAVAHTGSFDATLSASSIAAGESVTLTVTMPDATGNDIITISSTADGIDDFVINVSGTIRDASKVFETLLGGALPEDWTSSGSWTWNTTTGAKTSAWYESGNARLITPQLTVAEGELFSVEVQGTYEGYQGFKLEYSADGSTWTASATVPTITSEWQTLSFNDIPAGKYYIALHGWQVNIRNYYGGFIPSVPKDITLDSKTANSLTLSWTAAGSETAWKLQYSTDGEKWSADVAVAAKPFELTNLKANTPYYVRVKANAEGAEWSKVASFRTACGAVDALPYTENFEGHDLNAAPLCWELLNATSTGISTRPYVAIYNQSGYYKDAKALFFRTDNTKVSYAIFPEFDFTLAKAEIAFSHKEESGIGTLVLGYLTNIANAETFVALYTCTSSSSWTDEEGISLATVPEGARLAFQHTVTSSYYDAAVDNITIDLAPACVKPTGLTVSEESAHGAKVAWTSEATKWDLEYKLSSAADWTAAESVTNPFTLTELDANAAYAVRVRNNCGDAQSDWVETSFNTLCEAKTLPFAEDFESGAFADCWSADSRWTINANAHESSYSARYNSGAAAEMVLPSITLDDEAMLYYWHQSSYPTGAVLVNGTQVQTIATTSGNWKKDSVDLSEYKGQTIVITFKSSYTTYSNRYLYIDDIAVEVLPCAKPTELKATANDDSKVKLSWTSEVGKYNFQWREVGGSWSDVEELTVNEKTLEGLTLGKEYEFQVQAVCSATRKSDFVTSEAFAPKCPTPGELSLSEKTYNSVKVSWTAGGGETAWKLRTNKNELGWSAWKDCAETTFTLTELDANAEYAIEVVASCNGEAAVATYTPVYSKPASASVSDATDNGAKASWDAVADAPNGYKYVVVEKGAEVNWASDAVKSTTETSAALSGLDAKKEYDFYVCAVYGDNMGAATKASFETVIVEPVLGEVSVTANSAKLTWTKAGVSTAFEYAVGDDADNLKWSALEAGTTEFELKELTANTSYTFYLRSVYSEDVKSDSVFTTFTTLCDVFTLPFEQNFNDLTTGIPACWENIDEGAYGVKWAYTATGHEGAAVRLNCNSYPVSSKVLATPTIVLSKKAILKFWYQNANGGEFAVKLSANGGEQVTIASGLTGIAKWTEKEIDLSAYEGKSIVLYFCGTTNDKSAYIYLDDVTITEKPGCSKPQITATTVRPDGAKIEWEAGNGETQFQYACYFEDMALINWTVLDENVFSVTIEGQYPDITYDVYVRAYCSADQQSEAVKTSFTPSCPAPTAVTVSDVTSTGAKISWTAAEGITKYQYKLNDEPWATEQSVEATSLELSSLTPNTLYTFSVRSFFNDNIQSTIATVEFRTECAAISELPWSEDFNDFAIGAAPNCWEAVNANAEGKAKVTVDAVMDFTNLDSKALVFYGKASQGYSYIKFPEITASLIGKQITFTVQAENYDKSGAAEFGYFDGDEFKLLKKYTHTTGAKVTVDPCMLDAANGKRLAFGYLCENSYEYGIAIDNIVIEDKPSCTVPTELKVTEITATSAKVTWESEASNFALLLKEGDDDWKEVNAVITENSYVLTNLNELTDYAVRIQANCGGEDWSAPTEAVEFTTPCAVKAFGYTENFDEGLNACWDNSDVHGMNSWAINEGTIRYRTTSNTSNYAALVTPWIAVANEGTPVLLFDWANDGAKATLFIEVEGQDAIVLKDLSEETEGEWVKLSLTDYAGKIVRFTFKGESTASGKYMTLDNFQVIEKPYASLVPTDLTAVVTEAGVSVTWTAAWDETKWDLQWGKKDEDKTLVEAWELQSYLITATEDGEYEVQVRAAFDATNSEWSDVVTFEISNETTGISNTAVKATATKRIVNGQLIIELDGEQYNAQGVNLK